MRHNPRYKAVCPSDVVAIGYMLVRSELILYQSLFIHFEELLLTEAKQEEMGGDLRICNVLVVSYRATSTVKRRARYWRSSEIITKGSPITSLEILRSCMTTRINLFAQESQRFEASCPSSSLQDMQYLVINNEGLERSRHIRITTGKMTAMLSLLCLSCLIACPHPWVNRMCCT